MTQPGRAVYTSTSSCGQWLESQARLDRDHRAEVVAPLHGTHTPNHARDGLGQVKSTPAWSQLHPVTFKVRSKIRCACLRKHADTDTELAADKWLLKGVPGTARSRGFNLICYCVSAVGRRFSSSY